MSDDRRGDLFLHALSVLVVVAVAVAELIDGVMDDWRNRAVAMFRSVRQVDNKRIRLPVRRVTFVAERATDARLVKMILLG